MKNVRVTHIGGPTALIEVGDWRLLTDPTFDPPGKRYAFGWGTSSRKLTGPAGSRLSSWWSWLSSTASIGGSSDAAMAGPVSLRELVPQPNA